MSTQYKLEMCVKSQKIQHRPTIIISLDIVFAPGVVFLHVHPQVS